MKYHLRSWCEFGEYSIKCLASVLSLVSHNQKPKKTLFGKCKKYSQKTEEILSLRYWVVEKKFPI
jgi:hypothetical protein